MLQALLGHRDFDGRDALLAQIDAARVVGRCGCGCATVDLEVEGPSSDAAVSSPIPNQGDIIGPDDERIGGVLLFARDGRLSMLEVYANTDQPIHPLPSAKELDLYQLPIE